MIVLLCGLLAGASDDASAGAFEGVGAPPLSEPLSDAEEIDALTMEVAGILRSPVCQGLSVADSSEGASLAMRERIREMIAAGYTQDQVVDYFVDRYGEGIVLLPDRRHWMVWIGPLVILLVGGGIATMRMRSKDAPATTNASAAAPSSDDEHRAAILAELED